MLKANETKLIGDYADLIAKRDAKFSEIEKAARAYAAQRGYTTEKTDAFIDFCKKNEGGLSEEDEKLLSVLSAYVSEIEDPKPSEAPEAETAIPAAGTVMIG